MGLGRRRLGSGGRLLRALVDLVGREGFRRGWDRRLGLGREDHRVSAEILRTRSCGSKLTIFKACHPAYQRTSPRRRKVCRRAFHHQVAFHRDKARLLEVLRQASRHLLARRRKACRSSRPAVFRPAFKEGRLGKVRPDRVLHLVWVGRLGSMVRLGDEVVASEA